MNDQSTMLYVIIGIILFCIMGISMLWIGYSQFGFLRSQKFLDETCMTDDECGINLKCSSDLKCIPTESRNNTNVTNCKSLCNNIIPSVTTCKCDTQCTNLCDKCADKKSETTAPVGKGGTNIIKEPIPRLTTITDCGYGNMTRGWYDIQNQGVKNDYCRYVGDGTATSPKYFSCAKAGASNQYTPLSEIIDPNLPHDDLISTDPCKPSGSTSKLIDLGGKGCTSSADCVDGAKCEAGFEDIDSKFCCKNGASYYSSMARTFCNPPTTKIPAGGKGCWNDSDCVTGECAWGDPDTQVRYCCGPKGSYYHYGKSRYYCNP